MWERLVERLVNDRCFPDTRRTKNDESDVTLKVVIMGGMDKSGENKTKKLRFMLVIYNVDANSSNTLIT